METTRPWRARRAIRFFAFTFLWFVATLVAVVLALSGIQHWSGVLLSYASIPVFVLLCVLTWRATYEVCVDREGGVLVFIGFCLGLVGCLGSFFLPMIAMIRPAADRMWNATQMATISNALVTYDGVHGHLPPPASTDSLGRPLLSWRVLILPSLGQEALYKEFRLDEPWDSPHNLKLLPRMPKVYEHPMRAYQETGMTHYQVFVGGGAVFDWGRTRSLKELAAGDGLSYTILVIDARDAVPWTKPADLEYDPTKPLPGFHTTKGRVMFSFATGERRELRAPETPEWERLFRALITWNGKEETGNNPLLD